MTRPMGERPILILRAGEAPGPVRRTRGDFPEWIRKATGEAWSGPWAEHDVRTDADLPALGEAAAWIVTGSAASVTERAAWMLRAEEFLRAGVAAGVPILGICFGHQMLAQALGGWVTKSPRGRELGTVALEADRGAERDALFGSLPARFDVNASHVDSVVRLPEGARVLATTALEPVAAYAVGPAAWGVQFHPEFDADIVRGYVRVRSELMVAEGLVPARAIETAADTPHGRAVLQSFARRVSAGVRPEDRAPE